MNRRKTNEKLKEFIAETSDKIREEIKEEYNVAEMQMFVAEDELVKSLDKNQKLLYEKFCLKRKEFLQVAENCYTRII